MGDNHKEQIDEYFSKKTRYWNDVYEKKEEEIAGFPSLEMHRRRQYILDYLGLKERNECLGILDIGCGAGNILGRITELGYKAAGLDISMDMLLKTKKILSTTDSKDIPLIQGDIEALPFSDKSLDGVICIGVIQYLEVDDKALKEIYRVTKKGGFIIITAPNLFAARNLLDPYYYLVRGPRLIMHKLGIGPSKSLMNNQERDFKFNTDFSNRRYKHAEIISKLRSNKFRLLKCYAVGFGPLTFWQKRLLPFKLSKRISDTIEQWSNEKNSTFWRGFASRWIFCLEKDEQ
jgi:ubiquinone/menaquinone biosynthesis C-methylase UbiE